MIVVLACAADLTGPWTAAARSAEPRAGAAVEALIARGITDSAGSEMRRGLTELRAAIALDPGNALARRSLAVALLKAGRFGEAESQFSSLVGRGLGTALANGSLVPADVPRDADPDALLGLATAVQFQDRPREAERLYRAYAILVGPMTPEAGRAYMRLQELAAGGNAIWLDADAEMAKAKAVDPDIGSARLLPGFADPHAIAELEPYVRPVELSLSRADTAVEYDSLPVLDRWVAPSDTTQMALGVSDGSLRLELLVDADGHVRELQPPAGADEAGLERLLADVSAWLFTPAVADGQAASAWILFGRETGTDAKPAEGAQAHRPEVRQKSEGGETEPTPAGDSGEPPPMPPMPQK